MIIFGPIGREVLSLGTIIFAIFALVSIFVSDPMYVLTLRDMVKGSEIISGQFALAYLSNNGLCNVFLALIFSAACFVVAIPRTLDRLSWLGVLSAFAITICGILAMVGAGANPTPGRVVQATVPATFYDAFLAITNPVMTVDNTITCSDADSA